MRVFLRNSEKSTENLILLCSIRSLSFCVKALAERKTAALAIVTANNSLHY
jgi:hypothetical protein